MFLVMGNIRFLQTALCSPVACLLIRSFLNVLEKTPKFADAVVSNCAKMALFELTQSLSTCQFRIGKISTVEQCRGGSRKNRDIRIYDHAHLTTPKFLLCNPEMVLGFNRE